MSGGDSGSGTHHARSPLDLWPADLDPTDLVGSWKFRRDVNDRFAGQRMHATGLATFTAVAPGRLTWSEVGELQAPQGAVPVRQTRRLERQAGGAAWEVLFADGRLFHPWSVGVEVVHDCAPDVYRGLAEPLTPTSWRLTWHSRGPAKDFTIVTEYRRGAARAA